MNNSKPSDNTSANFREDQEPISEEPETIRSSSEEIPARRSPSIRTVAVCAGAAIAVVGLAALCASVAFGPARDPNPTAGQAPSATPGSQAQFGTGRDVEGHSHVWMPMYGVERQEAVTESREVDSTYESRTTAHTVCNDCLAIVDGTAQQHLDETGHSGYTPEVPVTDEVMIDEGGIVTVVVEEGSDNIVITGEKCALCGEERDLPDGEAD